MQMAQMVALMAALLVVAAVVPPSSAADHVVSSLPGSDECLKTCAKYEKTESAHFDQCKDECALEAEFKAATEGLEACNKACETKGGSTAAVGVCMEACTIKVDAAVGVVATRACHRDCARTSKDAAARKKCDDLCEASGDKKSESASATGEKDAAKER